MTAWIESGSRAGDSTYATIAIALSFATGFASAALVWWTLVEHPKTQNDDDDVSSRNNNNTNNGGMLRRRDSFLDSIKSHIGELPSRLPSTRTRWPWDTMLRRAAQDDDSTSTDSPSPFPSPPLSGNSSKDVHDGGGEQKKSGLCIGSIFGLDVGGTLAKLVYFENHKVVEPKQLSKRDLHYHQAASALTVVEARRSPRSRRRSSTLWDIPMEGEGDISSGLMHSFDSEEDLQRLKQLRQESVPDNLDQYAESCNLSTRSIASHGSLRDVVMGHEHENGGYEKENDDPKPRDDVSVSSTGSGGGMRRSKSMFDLSKSRDHAEALDRFYNFARRLETYETAVKDKHLSFYSRELGGEFHFIRFETRRMENAMDLIRVNNLHLNIREMGATGGGAHKYADDWQRELGIEMVKQDELDSLVAGMQFILSAVVGECYTFRPKIHERPYGSSSDLSSTETPRVANIGKMSTISSGSLHDSETSSTSDINIEEPPAEERPDKPHVDEWWWSRKVQRDVVSDSSIYPYLLVTIGTGVSILRVDGPRKHERISGSTIGGGTYWGLIRLLTDVNDFEDVMKLAERGDPSKVDMMVGDIYGQNSDALEKVGLASNLVASSFGKLVAKHDPASGIKQEDLARALLLMVTNNIGQVAYLNAQLHNTRRIYFVGNFLRCNVLSQQRLAFAIDYWSKGKMEALFLEHEGYFGALGAFLLSQGISSSEHGFFQWQSDSTEVRKSEPLHRRSQTMAIPHESEAMHLKLEEPPKHRRSRTMTAG